MQAIRTTWFWIVLFPISCVWAFVTYLRRRFYPAWLVYNSNLKVICVGNIHSGGSGKTPLVKAIVNHLYPTDSPVVLARGYHGKLSRKGAEVALESANGSGLFGDEPWMLANELRCPVFINKRRVKGVKAIEARYPNSVVILDDGFQHLSLGKSLNIVCINTLKRPVENYCLPLGELREPVSSLAFADAVVLTPGGIDATDTGLETWLVFIQKFFPQIPCFVAERNIEGFYQGQKQISLDSIQGWGAFSGVAGPERFVSTLASLSPNIRYLKSFPDHWKYCNSDVTELIRLGETCGAQRFITTDKDWHKVAEFFGKNNKMVVSLRMGYHLSDEFWNWLKDKLGQ